MSDLPKDWVWVPIAEIAEGGLFIDGDWVESKDQDPFGDVRLVQLADVGDGKYRFRSDRWRRAVQAERLRVTYLEAEDILVARMPDPLGRACMMPALEEDAATAVDVAILRIRRTDVLPKYVMWALNSPAIRAEMLSLASGTTRQRISRKNLGLVKLPLPPLAVQHRIVETLEDHLIRLDKAAEVLQETRSMSELLRKSILDRALFSKQTEVAPLGNLGSWHTGATPKTTNELFEGNDVPFVTPGDVPNGGEIEKVKRFVSQAGADAVKRVPGPSVQLVCIGATLGKVGISRHEVTTNQQINSLQPNPAIADVDYAHWLLASLRVQELLWGASSSTTVPILNKGALTRIEVPILNKESQKHAVDEIMVNFDSVTRLNSFVIDSQENLSQIRRSLLHAAFAGQLTNEDSND